MKKFSNYKLISIYVFTVIAFIILLFSSTFAQRNQKVTDSPSNTIIKRESNRQWLYINDIKQPAIMGIVYQPTYDNRHGRDYRNNLSDIYSALLPEELGGKGHGRQLETMGIQAIRVYELPVSSPFQVDSVKKIFRYVFQNHGIRVMVGDWVGLHSNINYNVPWFYEEVVSRLKLLAKTYCHEPWILGWQLGNDNNYYILGGKLSDEIQLKPEHYYFYMDFLAGAIREALVAEDVQQIIAFGQGDLTETEAQLIKNMRNIDAIGISCYRSPIGENSVEKIIALVNQTLPDFPIYFAEFGKSAANLIEEKQQAEYLQQMSAVIFSHSAGIGDEANVIGAFLYEATDAIGKQIDRNKMQNSSYGILGKKSELDMTTWIRRNKSLQEAVPKTDEPDELLSSIWDLLQGDYAQNLGAEYGLCIKYSNRLIRLYQKEADRQQETLQRRSASIKEAAVDSCWALNSVGTAYYIKGRSQYEMAMHNLGAGRIDDSNTLLGEASKEFSYVSQQYPYSHIRGPKGDYWNIERTVRSFFPQLSKPYINVNTISIIVFVILPLLVISHQGKKIHSTFVKLFQKTSTSTYTLKPTLIQDKPVMKKGQKIIFFATIAIQLICLFRLLIWWVHPIRLEFYTVNPVLYWILFSVAIISIVFNFFVWYVLWAMKRPVHQSAPKGKKVAMVTTHVHGEPVEDMLKNTLSKMINVRYPHEVFLLDEENDPAIIVLCKKLGVRHFSRKEIDRYNSASGKFQARTKGGNLNAWLDAYGHEYEFVTFLDPDHEPEPDFLHCVLGYFKDENVGFVQGPQIYKNQKDNWIARGAAEQSYFFDGPIQMGLYGLDTCMLIGSHSTIRISALEKIGGYAVHDADDVLTCVRLYMQGYKGIYVPQIIARGETANTWLTYLKQQRRWAASVFDLMLHQYPRLLFKYRRKQALIFMVLALFYFKGTLLSSLFLLPIISIISTNAIVNAELLSFCGRYFPCLALHYVLLLIFGQQYLIKNGSQKGFWFRAGLLWIATWPYYSWAFLKSIPKRQIRDREVAQKGVRKPKRDSAFVYFIPHLIVAVLSLGCLLFSFIKPSYVQATSGMQLFLTMGFVSQGIIFLLGIRNV